MSKEVYSKITTVNANWNKVSAPEATLYPWDLSSTSSTRPSSRE